ncbi:exodeoxyribonuclease VII large subunit [Pseudoclavibacter sp. Z016]|uniref:exodeoxyribonuclease VII large subunit n=1 Tax=Pseudoclavibacter sp. Z016 TaxID=2080581 RepID=UPI0035BE20EF
MRFEKRHVVVIQPPKSTPDAPWPVSVVSELVRDWIARLGSVWIEGELTGWSIRGGHAYGKIKDLDADATLSVTAWRSVVQRLDSEFKQGDRVIASIKPDFWVKGGTLSMQVSDLRHVGLGDLLERLERLRKQLAAEGLFADERKKPLPFLPGTIGLITGRESDAEKDVRRNSELRWPAVQFRTIHTPVQGDRTVAEVSAALRELDADPEVDVIIVARGGGDFQHLLPFSDESLVRLVATLSTPVVSAIGHEADRPILDDVADLRASTPTDAAKRVVPDVAEELAGVQQARARILQRIVDRVRSESNALESLVSRPALANPSWIIDQRGEELMRASQRGEELITRRIDREHDRLESLARHLRGLSPQGTLERGYSIVERVDGGAKSLVTGWQDAPASTELRIRTADGRISASSLGGEAIITPGAPDGATEANVE